MSEMKMAPHKVRKIYLSGAISGLPIEQARDIFNKYEQSLKAQYKDIVVINPLSIGLHKDASWGDQMIKVLHGLNESDAIFMISGWSDSDGALVEYLWAEREGKVLLGATEEIHMALAKRVDRFQRADLAKDALSEFKDTVWDELTSVVDWRPWGRDFHREISAAIHEIVSNKEGMCLELLVQASNGDYDLEDPFALAVTDVIDIETHYNTYKKYYVGKYPVLWENICKYESMLVDSSQEVQKQMRASVQYETWDLLSRIHWFAFGSRDMERVLDKALNRLSYSKLVSVLSSKELDNTLVEFSNYSNIPIKQLVERFINKAVSTGYNSREARESNSKYVSDYMSSMVCYSDEVSVKKYHSSKCHEGGLDDVMAKSLRLPQKRASKINRGL